MAIDVSRMTLFRDNKQTVKIERITETDTNDCPTADGIGTIVSNQEMLIRKNRSRVEQDGELVSFVEFTGYLSPVNTDIKRGHRVIISGDVSDILEIVDVTAYDGFQKLIMNSKEY